MTLCKKVSYLPKDKYDIINKGVWSSNCSLSFNSGKAVSSSFVVGKDFNCKVDVISLDSYLKNNRVDFIKMDVEGAEYEALKGATEIIKNQHPVLAISLYHKPEDVFEIPKLILDIYSGYKLYLRHYSFSRHETVLYAIP